MRLVPVSKVDVETVGGNFRIKQLPVVRDQKSERNEQVVTWVVCTTLKMVGSVYVKNLKLG